MSPDDPLDRPVEVRERIGRRDTVPYGHSRIRPSDVLAALDEEQREALARRLAQLDYEATFDTGKADDYDPTWGPYDEPWESTPSSFRKECVARFEHVVAALCDREESHA